MTDEPTDPAHDPSPPSEAEPADVGRAPADLDRIARDLAGVEAALRRLDDGSYWTDEATDEAIPDEVLAADPVARRAG